MVGLKPSVFVAVFALLGAGVGLVGCDLPPIEDERERRNRGEGEGEGEGDEAVEPARCRAACSLDEDCNTSQRLFTCEDGGCFFVGCAVDADCGDGWRCRDAMFFTGQTACVFACSVDADCNESFGTYGSSVCEAGVCRSTGCTSDDECRDRLQDPELSCVTLNGATVSSCQIVCGTDADCAAAIPNFPFELACTDGLCGTATCAQTSDCPAEAFGEPQICL
jgi:hypothetical protein